jgi:uncharacterized membrane protein
MVVSLILLIGYFAFNDFRKAEILTAALITHSFGGRAAGVGLCIIAGFPPYLNILYNMYLEVMIVFLIYFIFVYSVTNHIKTPWVVAFTDNLRETAFKNKDNIEKYGWIGLFFFVMLPIPFTGPVMGSIIGFLLQMKVVKNFSAVFPGTLAAIVLWVLCFQFLDEHLHVIQYFLVVIIGIVLFMHFKTIKAMFFKKK